VVTGSGSAWSNANDLYVGLSGAGNRLVVGNGGVVRNSRGYVGGNTFSSNNLALVTGAGSLWTNRQQLHIGLNGTGNQLVVSNGGTVFTAANKVMGTRRGLVETRHRDWPRLALAGRRQPSRRQQRRVQRLIVSGGGQVGKCRFRRWIRPSRGHNQVLVTGAGQSGAIGNLIIR